MLLPASAPIVHLQDTGRKSKARVTILFGLFTATRIFMINVRSHGRFSSHTLELSTCQLKRDPTQRWNRTRGGEGEVVTGRRALCKMKYENEKKKERGRKKEDKKRMVLIHRS